MDAHTVEVPPAVDPPRALCIMLCNEDCVPAWLQTTCLMKLECFVIPSSAGHGHQPISPVYSARRAPCHVLHCADLRELGGREEESRARGRSRVSLDPESNSNSSPSLLGLRTPTTWKQKCVYFPAFAIRMAILASRMRSCWVGLPEKLCKGD